MLHKRQQVLSESESNWDSSDEEKSSVIETPRATDAPKDMFGQKTTGDPGKTSQPKPSPRPEKQSTLGKNSTSQSGMKSGVSVFSDRGRWHDNDVDRQGKSGKDQPPYDFKGVIPPGRDQPPYDFKGVIPPGRDQPLYDIKGVIPPGRDQPPYDFKGVIPPGRDQPPYDIKGVIPPGRDQPPYDFKGVIPPGRDQPPYDIKGVIPPGRDQPPYDFKGVIPPGRDQPPYDIKGVIPPGRDQPPYDFKGVIPPGRDQPPYDIKGVIPPGRDQPPYDFKGVIPPDLAASRSSAHETSPTIPEYDAIPSYAHNCSHSVKHKESYWASDIFTQSCMLFRVQSRTNTGCHRPVRRGQEDSENLAGWLASTSGLFLEQNLQACTWSVPDAEMWSVAKEQVLA
uniref:Uncharacterized protein n=1 Tax=Branchiostoma floridae TaxID=7739 RepID=C3ZXW0_BRAFL|eukprot:XP_002586609.1 hypothetical protein BRAFLDRAFT_131312 [Branchiostoma floridae]